MHPTPRQMPLCCTALFLLAAALPQAARAQSITLKLGPTPPPARSGVSPLDCCFMRMAAVAGMKEIEISEAVLGQLSSAELKSFARKVIADHTAANAELLDLARRKGAGFSTKVEDPYSDWSRKTDDIDRRYVREIISDHLDEVDLFERASKSGDPDVAAFAQRMLATLREQLMLAHDVRKTVD
jgi:putative membrane protein